MEQQQRAMMQRLASFLHSSVPVHALVPAWDSKSVASVRAFLFFGTRLVLIEHVCVCGCVFLVPAWHLWSRTRHADFIFVFISFRARLVQAKHVRGTRLVFHGCFGARLASDKASHV